MLFENMGALFIVVLKVAYALDRVGELELCRVYNEGQNGDSEEECVGLGGRGGAGREMVLAGGTEVSESNFRTPDLAPFQSDTKLKIRRNFVPG